MRIWSLHSKYLDSKGLVALWRETLLAKCVLEGKTKGYRNHPQLLRFRKCNKPVDLINEYLSFIYYESVKREFSFNKDKIDWGFKKAKLSVTDKQVDYEREHLLAKLKVRDINKFNEISKIKTFECHPIFKIICGDIEYWEVL